MNPLRLILSGGALAVAVVAATLTKPSAAEDTDSFPVKISVDASKPTGELKPIWRFFGADEPNYATMKDGRKLLMELGELDKDRVYFRAHNLLCTGDGKAALKWGSTNIYTEDENGNPIYDYTIVDEIIDTYRARGVRPYLQIGFMPKALSTNPEPYQHKWRPGLKYDEISTGWAFPPKDYNKWAELVYQWTKHCVERYGREEVETWYFEVWNEPNGRAYWRSSVEEFCKLHDYAIDAVRRALPTARVGGPDTAGDGGKFMDAFRKHVTTGTNYATGKIGTPTDFVAFHAKGNPKFIDGRVQMGIANQLRTIDTGFRRIAAVPQLKDTPIIIGECDPEGCAACQGPQLAYRNGTMYSSYTAASFARIHDLADVTGVNLEGALTWAFEFEDQPYFAGFRVLATNGIDLPVLNVFRMFSKMGDQRLAVKSDAAVSLEEMMKTGVRGRPDVSALAASKDGRTTVMLWHYHDDDLPGPSAAVTLDISGLKKSGLRVRQFRIDETNSNAFTLWKKMGSPQKPTSEQYAQLEKAGQLAEVAAPSVTAMPGGNARLEVDLPRRAVSLLVIE
jgi:xylan 1,4-beta-xylosidase